MISLLSECLLLPLPSSLLHSPSPSPSPFSTYSTSLAPHFRPLSVEDDGSEFWHDTLGNRGDNVNKGPTGPNTCHVIWCGGHYWIAFPGQV